MFQVDARFTVIISAVYLVNAVELMKLKLPICYDIRGLEDLLSEKLLFLCKKTLNEKFFCGS